MYVCRLCERELREPTTEHHLIPRTCHSNRWFKKQFSRELMIQTVSLCKDCHRTIHEFIPDEKKLGRYYNTLELLKAHPKIATYLVWIRKQK